MKPIFESTGAGRAERELVTYIYRFGETIVKVVRALGGPPEHALDQSGVLELFSVS